MEVSETKLNSNIVQNSEILFTYDFNKISKISEKVNRFSNTRKEFETKFNKAASIPEKEKFLLKTLEIDESILKEISKTNTQNEEIGFLKNKIITYYEDLYKNRPPRSLELWRRLFEFMKIYNKQQAEILDHYVDAFRDVKDHPEKYYLLLIDILKYKIEILQSTETDPCIYDKIEAKLKNVKEECNNVNVDVVKLENHVKQEKLEDQVMKEMLKDQVKIEKNIEEKPTDLVEKEGNTEKIEEIFINTYQTALKFHKSSVLLWAGHLKFHISRGDLEKSNKVFNAAIQAIPNYRGFPFWQLMVIVWYCPYSTSHTNRYVVYGQPFFLKALLALSDLLFIHFQVQFYEIKLDFKNVMALIKRAILEGKGMFTN